MTKSFFTSSSLLLCLLPFGYLSLADAQEGKEAIEPTGEEILKLVRYSQAMQSHDLNGRITKGKTKIPMKLLLRPKLVQFRFGDPIQAITLDLNDKSYVLREQTGGKNEQIPTSRYGEKIRGTDLTYEDISMRFLYWPRVEKMGDERIRTQKCWKIRVRNDRRSGVYAAVDAWVGQQSGALMRLIGYDWGGKPVKQFKVNSGQKIDGVWMLKEMKVETLDPAKGRPVGDPTYLRIEKD